LIPGFADLAALNIRMKNGIPVSVNPVRGFFFGYLRREEIGKRVSCITGKDTGSREGSGTLPPPRDCNPDENRMYVTVPKGMGRRG
jgi:hypothetical protein